ncbi:MAG: sigma-70 family RNA polymerase sigma factor [Dehalococcoidia bacterium]
MDEAELLERCRDGDLDAFNSLVALHQDQVYNLCLRMLASPAAAEDAAQEAFISAFRKIASMRGPSARSWLLRIAANTCIDELRRRKRRPQVSLDVPVASEEGERSLDVPDGSAGPEQLALRGEVREALQAELSLLPADQRLAIILCDVEGLSYEEVASTMGGSLGTVKSRISRGRARLREALRGRPELFGDLVRHTKEGN